MFNYQNRRILIFAVCSLLVGGTLLALSPELAHACNCASRGGQLPKERCGPIALKVSDRAASQPMGSCPVFSSSVMFTPYPKIEVYLPPSGILDMEPKLKFRARSVRFSLKPYGAGLAGAGYGVGIDNVAPFRLLDALPKARIGSEHAVVYMEFFSAPGAKGRLIQRMHVYVARYAQDEHATAPAVNLMCLEQVESQTPLRLDKTAILEDKSLRVVGVQGYINQDLYNYPRDVIESASVLSYLPNTSESATYPLRASAEGGKPSVGNKPLFAIDGNGYVAEAYSRKDGPFTRLFNPAGSELFVRPLKKDDWSYWASSEPMMAFFFPGGFGVRTWQDFAEGELRIDYGGETIAAKLAEGGEYEHYETQYVDDPNDGYYIKGLHWFVFCELEGAGGYGGAYPYIKRVSTDADISVGYDQGFSFTYLAPHLTPLPGKPFPWESWYGGSSDPTYGFERACFNHTVMGIETDDSSNAYVLYGLHTYPYLKERFNWPVARINQLQKISPAGELLWQKTLSGELFDKHFDVSYEFPGLIPLSINWIKDRELLMVVGKVLKGTKSGKSRYFAIFIDREGNVVNAQALGYLLPAGERFAPYRSNTVSDNGQGRLYFFGEKSTDLSPKNEHWLTTVNVKLDNS